MTTSLACSPRHALKGPLAGGMRPEHDMLPLLQSCREASSLGNPEEMCPRRMSISWLKSRVVLYSSGRSGTDEAMCIPPN